MIPSNFPIADDENSRESMMKRLIKFLRSALPADWTQLAFLFGVVCLFIARYLRWWPADTIPTPLTGFLDPAELERQAGAWWGRFWVVALHLILFGGSAGYFICFWPGSRPVQRILYWVCLPAIVGLDLICALFLYLVTGSPSVLGAGSIIVHRFGWALSVLWKLGPGFRLTLIGLTLVAFFTSRLASGLAALPLTLPESSVSPSDDDVSWRRVEVVVWILPVLALPLFIVTGLSIAGFLYVLLKLPFLAYFVWRLSTSIGTATEVAADAIWVGVVMWIMGDEAKHAVRRSVCLPRPESLAIALGIPVGIDVLIGFGKYLVDSFYLVVHHLQTGTPTQIASYFRLPKTSGLFSIGLAALFEEMIFRGLLQPRFVRRFGILRGIFLVAIIFGAMHFEDDFFHGFNDVDMLLITLGSRLFGTLALSFVLGWLTLRTGSVLPATICHGIYNVLVQSPFGPRFPALGTLRTLLWAVLAYVLFRYWPVRKGPLGESGAELADYALKF